jgi:hypothetical protein
MYDSVERTQRIHERCASDFAEIFISKVSASSRSANQFAAEASPSLAIAHGTSSTPNNRTAIIMH